MDGFRIRDISVSAVFTTGDLAGCLWMRSGHHNGFVGKELLFVR
jgi:hypothetical protein